MNIGVVGSGNMGRSLGILLAEQGHAVFFGARNPERAGDAAALASRGAHAGTLDEAAQFGDLLIWGVRSVPASQMLKDTSTLKGKVIVDMNNNETRTDGTLGPDGESVAEKLQRDIPQASVVKAFNTLPMEVFEIPKEDLQRFSVSVFIAADDASAKETVRSLVEQIGFSPVDLGNLRSARACEGIADLIRLLLSQGVPSPASISLQSLPQPKAQRLGGRQHSNFEVAAHALPIRNDESAYRKSIGRARVLQHKGCYVEVNLRRSAMLCAMKDQPTFTGQQAAIAQTALREALGLPPEQFPLEAFVGMVSDEIEQLRRAGKSDSEIASLIEKAIAVEVPASALTEFYASPEARGHHGG